MFDALSSHEAREEARSQAALRGNYAAVSGARAEVLPAPAPATYSGQQAPVSGEYLQAQANAAHREACSSWFDYDNNVMIGTTVGKTTILADSDPAGYLRAHGFVAVDGNGNEVVPSSAQARGLVGQVLQELARQSNRSGGGFTSSTVSFRDPQRPPAQALVHARRVR
jgi:hypothetical protein